MSKWIVAKDYKLVMMFDTYEEAKEYYDLIKIDPDSIEFKLEGKDIYLAEVKETTVK